MTGTLTIDEFKRKEQSMSDSDRPDSSQLPLDFDAVEFVEAADAPHGATIIQFSFARQKAPVAAAASDAASDPALQEVLSVARRLKW